MNSVDKYILDECNTETYSSVKFEKDYELTEKNSFVFGIQRSSCMNIIQGKLSSEISEFYEILEEYHDKEKLYVKAVNNLLKQKEYINLMSQYASELIDEEELNQELDKNEHKYLIKINDELNSKSFKALSYIIGQLEAELTDDDLGEIFSIRTQNFDNLTLRPSKLIDNERSLP